MPALDLAVMLVQLAVVLAAIVVGVRTGGIGLGLTITRKLLALYGSSVHVSSVPGEGSTFSFNLRLPLTPNSSGDSRRS